MTKASTSMAAFSRRSTCPRRQVRTRAARGTATCESRPPPARPPRPGSSAHQRPVPDGFARPVPDAPQHPFQGARWEDQVRREAAHSRACRPGPPAGALGVRLRQRRARSSGRSNEPRMRRRVLADEVRREAWSHVSRQACGTDASRPLTASWPGRAVAFWLVRATRSTWQRRWRRRTPSAPAWRTWPAGPEWAASRLTGPPGPPPWKGARGPRNRPGEAIGGPALVGGRGPPRRPCGGVVTNMWPYRRAARVRTSSMRSRSEPPARSEHRGGRLRHEAAAQPMAVPPGPAGSLERFSGRYDSVTAITRSRSWPLRCTDDALRRQRVF